MKLVVQLKLLPTETEAKLLDATAKQYITLINEILDCAIACDEMPKLSSSKLKAPLPSALKDQCRLDAKSIYDKVTKPGSKHNGKFPLLKKPVIVWNNQNYTVGKDYIAMPFFVDGKSRKMRLPPSSRMRFSKFCLLPSEAHFVSPRRETSISRRLPMKRLRPH